MRRFPLLVALALATPTLQAQTMYETYTGWAVPTEPVLPAAEAHPSLWFGADGLAEMQARWNSPAYAALRAQITADIATFKNRDPAATDPSDRAIMAKTLAFAWVISGDLIARNKAIQTLQVAYDNVPRTATRESFDGDYDEIYRATWLQNFCAAYDWLYGRLATMPDVEADVRARLAQETELLADNMVSGVRYAPRPHNHRSKPAYAVGTAALTLNGHPEAAGWLRLALEQQNTTTRYQFGADGVYREGAHYWMYTGVNLIPFLWQYRRVSGVDLFPAYRPAFDWPLRVRNGRGWLPAHEDGFPKPAPTHTVAAAYASTPTDLHPTAPLGELLQWNWQATDFFTEDYTGATNDVTWEIDVLLTWDAAIPATPPAASPTQALESGQVAFRNSWVPFRPENRYLLFHGVASADNHDHPDHLSYVVEAENTPLAVDAGYGPDGFSDDRRTWYTSAQAHNTVTVNGAPLVDYSTTENLGPRSRHFLDTPFYDFAEKEAPANSVAGGAEVRRGIAFPDERFWIVVDRGTSGPAATYGVQLHGRGTLARTDNRMTWTVPADRYGEGGRLHAAFFANGPLTISEAGGWTSLYFGHEEAQRYVQAQLQGTAPLFLHVLYPTAVGEGAPTITDRSAGGIVGAEIATGAGAASHVAAQRDGTLRTAGRVTTDAAFAWVGEEGAAAIRWAVTEGRTLAWDGAEPLFEASEPLTAAGERRAPARQTLHVEGVAGATTVTLRLLPAAARPTRITFDGRPLDYEDLGDGRVRFTLGTDGEVVVETNLSTDAAPSSETGALRLAPPQPNPFRGDVRLSITLAAPGLVRARVYDLLGRRLATLLDAPRGAGTVEVAWDGRAEGAALPGGVYVFEVEASGERRHVRGTLVR